LGVVVVEQEIRRTTTTAIESKDLLTPEQALKILAAPLFKIWLKLSIGNPTQSAQSLAG